MERSDVVGGAADWWLFRPGARAPLSANRLCDAACHAENDGTPVFITVLSAQHFAVEHAKAVFEEVVLEFVIVFRKPPRGGPLDLIALLALRDWDAAARLLHDNLSLIDSAGGALHLMAQRNDVPAVKWLLEHGANIDGRCRARAQMSRRCI